ncbi:transcription factor bHLH115 isoform X1 [Elaeis guineensis]|uniref:transcription factor bHLH115 isoform X1 n=1 Tax=Elaeis guineensis var. tenera TaxID=51953 RepID=UPI003C6D6C87
MEGIGGRMGSSGGGREEGWLLEFGLVDELNQASDFIWAPKIVEKPTASRVIIGFDGLHRDSSLDNSSSRKRGRVESCSAAGTKAGREKMRRDRLNDRFTELCSILDPGRPPKADKIAILSDATHLLNQLHLEAEKLKESNETLQDAIKSLKAEKLELRDEKVRLKAEKERMEQMLRGFSLASPFVPHPAAAAATFHAASFAACSKTIPYTNYLPTCMWQWMPPAALDTSQDLALRPPVA